jgi:hypothetical protein
MSLSPRRLTFAVGTSLLTASLATACADKPHVNVRSPQPEEHVNEGPEQAPAPEETPDPQDSPEPTDDAPVALDPDADGPSTVNVRHADPK